MAPTKIMMIRHGEKQQDFPDDANIDRNGQPDDASLNSQGWRRAQALVDFFRNPKAPGIVTPDTIFAAAPSAESARPKETVELLAEALWPDREDRRARFNISHGVGDLDGLITDIRSAHGAVLVCWEHKRIPPIADRLLSGAYDWPGHRFDVVWIFDTRAHGGFDFSQTPENVLPSDEDGPIRL